MSTLETGTDHLLGRIEGHVAVLSFNRPEARNALSDEMYAGFEKSPAAHRCEFRYSRSDAYW